MSSDSEKSYKTAISGKRTRSPSKPRASNATVLSTKYQDPRVQRDSVATEARLLRPNQTASETINRVRHGSFTQGVISYFQKFQGDPSETKAADLLDVDDASQVDPDNTSFHSFHSNHPEPEFQTQAAPSSNSDEFHSAETATTDKIPAPLTGRMTRLARASIEQWAGERHHRSPKSILRNVAITMMTPAKMAGRISENKHVSKLTKRLSKSKTAPKKQVSKTVRDKGPPTWSSSYDFFCLFVCLAIGNTNISAFPTLLIRYGGSAFLVPYTIFTITFGFPIDSKI